MCKAWGCVSADSVRAGTNRVNQHCTAGRPLSATRHWLPPPHRYRFATHRSSFTYAIARALTFILQREETYTTILNVPAWVYHQKHSKKAQAARGVMANIMYANEGGWGRRTWRHALDRSRRPRLTSGCAFSIHWPALCRRPASGGLALSPPGTESCRTKYKILYLHNNSREQISKGWNSKAIHDNKNGARATKIIKVSIGRPRGAAASRRGIRHGSVGLSPLARHGPVYYHSLGMFISSLF